jgi:hypothetical protein
MSRPGGASSLHNRPTIPAGKKTLAIWDVAPTARAFLERLHVVYPTCYCEEIRGEEGCRFRVDLGIALDAPLR